MPRGVLEFRDQPFGERKQIDCVEVYLPKSIRFLSELYQLLREKVTNRMGLIVLEGFSIYEVDGVFQGAQLWEQRTLVIRVLLVRRVGSAATLADATINDLGREIATRVAVNEEQIWICRYSQDLTIFSGLKRLLG